MFTLFSSDRPTDYLSLHVRKTQASVYAELDRDLEEWDIGTSGFVGFYL